ncbi:MAG: hypothetical protein DRI32_07540 [Chloroflexi bacterium]|nr:MAG: hypothetical protein DRI32_07540 [Chloroflexota bacterium]
MTKVKIHLRFDNPDGSSKDWIGEASNNGLNISWGKRGRSQQGIFLSSQKLHSSPFQELQARADKKRRKGYYDVVITQPEVFCSEVVEETEPEPQKVSNLSATINEWTNQHSGSWF